MKYYEQSNRFIHILILFLIWQVFAILLQNPFLLPSPIEAVSALYHKSFEYYFWKSLSSSMFNLFFAFLIGMSFLVCLCFFSMITAVKEFLKTITGIFGSMPSFAILPLMLIIFGISSKTMLALMVFSMLWINLSYALTAIEQARNKWSPHCKNLKLSISTQFTKVYIPAILPYLLNISKNSWILCWRTLLALEVTFGNLGSGAGIGVIITMDRVNFQTADIYAMILVIGFIGYTISWFFDKSIEKIRWHTNDQTK